MPSSASSAGGAKPNPSSRNVSATNRSSCSVLSTPPWRRYSNACATAPAGAVDSAASSAAGSASPPKASRGTPAAAHPRERLAARCPAPAAGGRHPRQQCSAEGVALEDAVPRGAEDGPAAAAVLPLGEQRLAAVTADLPVADLEAGCGRAAVQPWRG